MTRRTASSDDEKEDSERQPDATMRMRTMIGRASGAATNTMTTTIGKEDEAGMQGVYWSGGRITAICLVERIMSFSLAGIITTISRVGKNTTIIRVGKNTKISWVGNTVVATVFLVCCCCSC